MTFTARSLGLLATVVGVSLLSTSAAHAQGSSMFGGSGGRGGSSGSSALGSGGLGGLGSSLGSSMGSSARGGTGGAGGRAGGGQTGFGQGAAGQSAMGGAGAATGFNQSGFVGRSDNASRFVGNARAGQATAGGNNNVRTFNANNFNSDSFSNNRNGNAANANSPLSRFRPMQKVAFEYAASTPVVIQARAQALVEKTLVKLPPVPNSSVEVTMEESEAVLKGTVARERDKMLLEQLLRLEPGVRSIRNELTVTSPQPAL